MDNNKKEERAEQKRKKEFAKKHEQLVKAVLEIMELDNVDEIVLTKEDFVKYKLPLIEMVIMSRMMGAVMGELMEKKF